MDCPICYQKIKKTDPFSIINCNCKNTYHSSCIDNWLNLNKSCPTCRKCFIKPVLKRLRNRLPRRRNAMTPEISQELSRRLFQESIGINSSVIINNSSFNIDYTINREILL